MTELTAHSDSQLIVKKFHGQYETKDSTMAQYLQKVKALARLFQNFQLVQINRSLNNHADACLSWRQLRKLSKELFL